MRSLGQCRVRVLRTPRADRGDVDCILDYAVLEIFLNLLGDLHAHGVLGFVGDPATCGVRSTFVRPTSEIPLGFFLEDVQSCASYFSRGYRGGEVASMMSSPRAQLTRRTPFFIWAMDFSLIIPAVWG